MSSDSVSTGDSGSTYLTVDELTAKYTGKRVRVHRNLRDRTWTVSVGGKKVAGVQCVVLNNVEFRVQPAGRQKVVETQQKNVHAFAYGELYTAANFDLKYGQMVETVSVSYNPFRSDTFHVIKNGAWGVAVHEADTAIFSSKGVQAVVEEQSGYIPE